MGYTHYWENDINAVSRVIGWGEAIEDCKRIIDKSPVELDVDDCNLDGICLNGVEGEAYETFHIDYKDGSFCKTEHRPYDVVVVAILARMAEVDGFTVSSDGDRKEWAKGVALASKILGRKIENPIEPSENLWS